MRSHQNLPNLLIPGYHKAGTTTLFHELSKHPDICPSLVKEPFYFRPYINGKALPPIENYKNNFKAARDEVYLMEGSPTYIYGGLRAAKIIHETLGDVKIIICLRNPVNQLFSLYKHHLRFMKINQEDSFLTFLQSKQDYNKQYYDQHLQEWLSVFGDNVKCVFFDALIRSPETILPEIIAWLGLAPITSEIDQLSNANPGGLYKIKWVHGIALKIFNKFKDYIPHQIFMVIRKSYYKINGKPNEQVITPEAIAYLKPILEPHNKNLAQILQERGYRELPPWLTF